MSRRNVIVALCAAAVLLAAGGLFASNMGFKLNYTLLGTAIGVSASGTNTLALPFNRQIGIDNAEQLLDDINGTGSPTGQAANVQRYVSADNSLQVYAKAPADPAPFALDKGVGYFVKVNANVGYIVVGSDDPSYTHTFFGTPAAATGTNFYAVPYHTTTTNAEQLLDEINTTGSPTGQISNVQRFVVLDNSLQVYAKAPADPAPFALTPGEAYFVKVSGGSNVSYVPSHY